jgi:tetratricopeptide (TPR) repeat protein
MALCAGLELEGLEECPKFILEVEASKILEKILADTDVVVENGSILAAACLLAFVQANWTGPPCPESFPDLDRTDCLEKLSIDGETVYPLVKFPWLLVLGKWLAVSEGCHWWSLRASYLNQRILDNISSTLTKDIECGIREHSVELGEAIGGEIYVEAALMSQHIGNQGLAEEMLQKAADISGFRHELTGILGRRTKFQDFDIAQLAVKIKAESVMTDQPQLAIPTSDTPVSIVLRDEYLMDKAVLNETLQNIPETGSAILLADSMHVLKFYAKDTTVIEKAAALVQKVLDHPGDWCVYSSGLFLRSQLESNRARFVERAALQYQALVDQIKSTKVPFEERARRVFATPLPPEWELDRAQAKLFAGLGAYRTAAGIFERRQMWDEYIACLIQLGERKLAEELLVEKVRVDPNNFKMLCILGDLREDSELYKKAWELSQHRFARAMRSLGMYYIRTDRIQEAVEAFEKALALNGLYDKIWFLVGCAAIQLEDYKKALFAFSRTVSLDDDNSEAWNNLAAVHLHLGQTEAAFKALKEAGKRQYDSWKIWDNVFRTAMSLGELMEAISAYRRVAEIRQKETPLDNLYTIIDELAQVIDRHGVEDQFVRAVIRQISELLDGPMATSLSMSHEFWYLCAQYAEIIRRPADRLEFYFKAYRAMRTLPVEHDIKAFQTVLSCVGKIQMTLDAIKANPLPQVNNEEREYQLRAIIDGLYHRSQPTMGSTEEFSTLLSLKNDREQ